MNKNYLISLASYTFWGLMFSIVLLTLDKNPITFKSIATSVVLSVGFHYAFVWRAKKNG